MDEEFDYLSKNEISKLKSNKVKIEESLNKETSDNINPKTSSTENASTANKSKKYKVTSEVKTKSDNKGINGFPKKNVANLNSNAKDPVILYYEIIIN